MALKTRTKNLQEKAYQLIHQVLTNTGEKVKAITTMGKENMKEPVSHDLSPTPFLGHLKEQMGSLYRTRETVRMIENPEEIHNVKTREEEGDMDVGWDITSKDVERLRQFLTPTIHTLPNLEPVVQPYTPLGPVHDKDNIVRKKEQNYDIPQNDSVMQLLTPQTVHITPPDDNYVAPATNPMSNKQLNKFEEEFSHITEGIKSLREDGNKDFCQISNLKGMLKEFLVLILLFPFYFISLMYNRDIVQIKWGRGVELILDECSKPINRGLIQAIPTSLPPQPIGEATKASNL
ncbi:hypothetical protein Tco_0839354 [Tanacetum coccineum]|uniref:Uncharacterized protein n=1 Tax=Tanacetum coccineum TaxID=301880 RepID=A0ABQ5ASZ5_9ASTR